MAHSYEEGRLNLPFVGIATFGKNPYVSNWSNINADAAIIGAQFVSGAQNRTAERFGLISSIQIQKKAIRILKLLLEQH